MLGTQLQVSLQSFSSKLNNCNFQNKDLSLTSIHWFIFACSKYLSQRELSRRNVQHRRVSRQKLWESLVQLGLGRLLRVETVRRTAQQQSPTEAVNSTINNQSPNPVLNLPAPDINEEEKTLPRRSRTTLSQLRSGHSPFLQTYLNRINPNTYPNPNCPTCQIHPHTTNHIFNCPNNPTDLTIDSLWTSPVRAAEFIGLELREGVG